MIELITCEHGLGRLTPKACGRRWSIAHGKVPAKASTAAEAAQIVMSPCRTCTFGEARVDASSSAPAPLRTLIKPLRERLPVLQPGADITAREPEAPPPPSAPVSAHEMTPPVQEPAAGEEETTMRTATCASCSKDFKVESNTGRVPKRCPTCKGGGARTPAKRSARRRAAPVVEAPAGTALALRPPAQVEVQPAPLFRVRFLSVDIECANGAALEELLQIVRRAAGA